MAKKKAKPSVVRAGAQRAEVYNEGLCVYLHDEGHGERLRKMLSSGKYGAADADAHFWDNLSVPEFAAAVVKDRLALAYELRQDDEVVAEVAVGEPLTDQELSVARWFPPQPAKLHLPTGRLRVDTPNTMPLDPEENEDDGAVIEVPPGDYLVRLYRIDWDEMRKAEIKKYAGPQEFIVLTPAGKGKGGGVKWTSPILEYPEPAASRDWVGAFKIAGRSIECQVNFWDFWDWYRLNLDREAVKKAGIKVGSVLRFSVGKQTFDAVFIDDWKKDDFLTQYDKEKFDKAIADRSEVAIGGWNEFDEQTILGFGRYKAAKAVPEKYHETWTAVTAAILDVSFALPEQPGAAAAQVQRGEVRATALALSPTTLVVSATADDLAQAGFKPGDLLQVGLPKGTHPAAYGTLDDKQRHVHLTAPMSDFQLILLKKMQMHFFAGEKVKLKPADLEGMNLTRLARGERRPLVAYFPQATSSPMTRYLHLEPTYVDGNTGTFDWASVPEAGTSVVLTTRPEG